MTLRPTNDALAQPAPGGADGVPVERRQFKAVALGGGHGLYATLSAVRMLASDVTAVVTVADDGGSSGRLRTELGMLPPGDLRMALAALACDEPRTRMWADVMQHRFGGSGALAGHSVGNLILAGLTEVLGDTVLALDEAARLLGVAGRVVPMAPIPLDIEADVSGLEEDPRVSRVIRGQVAVATTPGKVRRAVRAARDTGSRRGYRGGRPGCSGSGFVVFECHSTRSGSGTAGRAGPVDGAQGAGAQPGTRARRNDRILCGEASARTLPTRA